MTQITSDIVWPPQYKIKKHRLAKYVKLRTTKTCELEITVPYRFNLNNIPSILEENRAWITKQMLKRPAREEAGLPHQLTIEAVGQTWQIHYVASDAKLALIERPHRELVLVGRIQDESACKEKLTKWVKAFAATHLLSQLKIASDITQLTYERARIRDQQTLWGSCTVAKSISLNYKLIFLPPHLVMHVLIHELCHTRYLNHSEKFWGLVAMHDPAFREHKRSLRSADQFLPGWIQ